jgi:GT2 family glycosyltransferase
MIDVLHNDTTTGMVGGFLCNPDGTEQPGGRRVVPTPWRAFVRAFGLSWLKRWFPDICSDFLLHRDPLPTVPIPVEAISGACMLVKAQAIKDVGLWDDNYFLHCEDLDWCIRFKQKGWDVVFVPDARVIHVHGACSRNRPFFVEWHKHRGMLKFYNKFFRNQYSRVVWELVRVGVWLRFSLVFTYHTTKLIKNKSEVGFAGISGWLNRSNQHCGGKLNKPASAQRLSDNSLLTQKTRSWGWIRQMAKIALFNNS